MLHSILNTESSPLSSKQLESILERKNELEMIETMKSILQQSFSEPPADSIVLPIIKNVSPSENKTLKRILHMFWPLVEFYDATGILKPYTILICNSILSDLKHPNEFIEISALRCVAALEIRKVVENVMQGVTFLLKSEITEVRAASGFCCLSVEQKFPGLVDNAELLAAALAETNAEASSWFFKAVCLCCPEDSDELFEYDIEEFDAFEDDYAVGSAIFECFDELSEQNQSFLAEKIENNMESFNPVVLSSAGVALRRFPLQSALCLLESCKDAPEAALLMVVDELSKAELADNFSVVVQSLCQVFLAGKSEISIYRLLKSHILLKFSESDAESAKVVVDALISSQVLETPYIDLELEIIETVNETAEACGGFAGIGLAGIREICRLFTLPVSEMRLIGGKQDSNYQFKILEEACYGAAKLLVQCGLSEKEREFEVLEICLAYLVNCVSDSGFKCLCRALSELLDNLEQSELILVSSALFELLKVPAGIELYENAEQKEFSEALQITSEDDDGDTEDVKLISLIKAGEYPMLTFEIIKTILNVALRLEYENSQFELSRFILGCSALLKSAELGQGDSKFCSNAVKAIYLYAEKGVKPKIAEKCNKELKKVNVAHSVASQKNASAPLSFSILQTAEAAAPIEVKKKFENFQILSQDPENLSKIHELSADADMIYSEAIVVLDKQQVTLHVLFVNRTDMPMSDVELELFASNSINIHRATNKVNLEANSAAFESYQVSINKCEAAVLYGNILCKVQQKTKSSFSRFRDLILRIQEIRLPISNFLKPFKVSMNEFQREWDIMEWESRGNLNCKKVAELEKYLNAFVVNDVDCDSVRMVLLSCMSVQNELILLTVNVVDGRATLAVKGNNKDLVKSIIEVVGAI